MFHHVPIILQIFPQAFNQPFASARVPNQAASLEVSSWTGSMEHPEIKRSFSDQFWTILGMIPQISPHYIIYYIYSIYYMHIYIIHCIYIYISKKTVKSQQWGRYSARNMWLTRRPRTKTWPGCCLSRNCCCCSCCLGRFATMRLTNLCVHVAPEIHENDL